MTDIAYCLERARERLALFDRPTRRAVLMRRGEEIPEDLRTDLRLVKQTTSANCLMGKSRLRPRG